MRRSAQDYDDDGSFSTRCIDDDDDEVSPARGQRKCETPSDKRPEKKKTKVAEGKLANPSQLAASCC